MGNKTEKAPKTAEKRAFSLQSGAADHNRITGYLTDGTFLWLYLAGTAAWLVPELKLPVSMAVCLLLALPAALLMEAAFAGKEKNRWWKALLYIALLSLVSAVGRGLWLNGVHQLWNAGVDVLGEHFAYLFPAYEVTVAEGQENLTLCAGLLWLFLVLALPGAYLVHTGNRLLLSLQTGAFLILRAVTGIGPGTAWGLFSLLCLLAVWLRGHAEQLPAGRQRLAALETFFLAALGACLLAGAAGLAARRVAPENLTLFSGLREKSAALLEDARFGGSSRVLPEGQFAGLGSFAPTDTPVLEVTMSQPESYYLRGYTGADYTGKGWSVSEDARLWKSRDLFYWLHQDGLYGQEILADAALALGGDEVTQEEQNQVMIRNLAGSARYCYVPYELTGLLGDASDLPDSQKIGDSGLLTRGLRGMRDYRFQALSNQVTRYPTYAAALLDTESLTEQGKTYQKLEEYYNAFVYDTYRDIPDNLRTELAELLGQAELSGEEKHVDYAEAKQNILYILTSDYQDTGGEAEVWNGNDFIWEFLNTYKKGYAVHFASAAVMMFRYYGIPARYVEGYLITPEDVSAMTPGEPYTLDETHAHAWVEYYQDGVGWLPFETTPSYLNIMEVADEYQDISGVSGGGAADQQQDSSEDSQEEEDESEEQQEDGPDWFRILAVLFLVGICLTLLIMLGFLIWVLVQRHKTRMKKKLFESPDRRVAVRALYEYTMNILSVAGVKIRNTSLYQYEKGIRGMFDEKTGEEYREVVRIRQEAVYSAHTMQEEQWRTMVQFKCKVWDRIYEGGDLIQRFQLKYIYFL